MTVKVTYDEKFVALSGVAASGRGVSFEEKGKGARGVSKPFGLPDDNDGVSWFEAPKLYWFEDAPPALQFNKYIRSGYRAGLSPGQCVCSWFYCHNESGNIWTHLLPAATILALLASQMLRPWPTEPFAFYANILPILLCFCGSIAYHTLMANHTRYRTWLFLDVCGVFALLVCGTHTLLYWGLFCHPFVRTAFIVGYYLAAVACVVGGLRAKSHVHRALPMLMLLLVRVGALTARLALVSGSPDANSHYIWMECLAMTGAVINVMRIPEKWVCPMSTRGAAYSPGILDYWLNSHQIMHILVAFALMHYHLGATHDYHHFVALDGVCD